MGIKVESDMLVLDNTFSKEDVEAIDEFVKINIDKRIQSIVLMLQERGLVAEKQISEGDGWSLSRYNELMHIIDLIQNSGESKEEFVIPNRKNNL